MSDVLDKVRALKLDLELAGDELDKHFKNVRIARIVGSSVGAGCTAVTIASGIAIPFTLGLSTIPLILSIVFGSVATAGSLAAGGATITGIVLEKKKQQEMNEKWEQVRKECLKIFKLDSSRGKTNDTAKLKEIFRTIISGGMLVKEQVNAMRGVATTVSVASAQAATAAATSAAETAATGATAAGEVATTAGLSGATGAACVARGAAVGSSKVAVTTAAKAATTAASKTATAGAATATRLVAAVQAPIVVVNVFLFGLSIYDIVTASVDLHKNCTSQAGDLLRYMAAELDVFFKDSLPTQQQLDKCLAAGK